MSTEHTSILAMRTRRTWFQELARTWRNAPWSAKLGFIIILLYGLVAVFANVIAPFEEGASKAAQFAPPSATHWLGTDSNGRDVFSQLIYGAKNTVGIALITVGLSFAIGGSLGIYAAVTRGWLDQILGRVVDVLMAIPVLIFALMILAMFQKANFPEEIIGKFPLKMVLILAVLDSTRVFRLARNTALNVSVQDFVEAARLRGEKFGWVVFREILPNILPPLIAEFGLRFCFVFLTITSLSFLGVGLDPKMADWGSMIRDNAGSFRLRPGLVFYPAAAIALLTIAVNFVVDWFLNKTSGLRDEK